MILFLLFFLLFFLILGSFEGIEVLHNIVYLYTEYFLIIYFHIIFTVLFLFINVIIEIKISHI